MPSSCSQQLRWHRNLAFIKRSLGAGPVAQEVAGREPPVPRPPEKKTLERSTVLGGIGKRGETGRQ